MNRYRAPNLFNPTYSVTMNQTDVEKEPLGSGPHQNQPLKRYGAPLEKADAVMIMVHGRGATPESMFPLADAFNRPEVHYIAPAAANHTWYPHSFLAPVEKNEPGITSGLLAIRQIVAMLNKSGIPHRKIILLGFSQGACLALEFAARHPQRYGGVAGLSGGLIGPEVNTDDYGGDLKGTPVFLGCSTVDPHIPKERVDETASILTKLHARVTRKLYEGMGHTVNEDEIDRVEKMIGKTTHNELQDQSDGE